MPLPTARKPLESPKLNIRDPLPFISCFRAGNWGYFSTYAQPSILLLLQAGTELRSKAQHYANKQTNKINSRLISDGVQRAFGHKAQLLTKR
jgi:hypothetical protein